MAPEPHTLGRPAWSVVEQRGALRPALPPILGALPQSAERVRAAYLETKASELGAVMRCWLRW